MSEIDHTDDSIERNQNGVPTEPLGRADVRIDVGEETYQKLHEEYCRAVDYGYSDGFDTFVLNNSSVDYFVTVDGEPVDPDVDEE